MTGHVPDMKESEIRAKVQKGWLRAIVTFEVVGKPAKHVEKALEQYLANLRKDERIAVIEEAAEEAIEHEDGMFSTYAECDMLVKDLETFTWLCINFSPASIEILEPDGLTTEAREITAWLNDLLSKIHEISTNFRSQKAANDHLTVAMNQLIQNAILLSLRSGAKTEKQIETDTGVLAQQLKPFIEHLAKKGKIVPNKGKYELV